MRILTGLCLLLSVVLFTSTFSMAATVDYYAILEKCDQARGNLAGVTWTVSVLAKERGETNNRSILVRSRGFDVVAETLKPAQRKGHKLILVTGNMWFYKPDLSKPVPVSKRQKLLGLAANGDIASTNYAKDYNVLSTEEGTLQGRPCYIFDLEAKTRHATYQRIKYWVDVSRSVGLRAEFYSSSGEKLLKSAEMEYLNEINAADGVSPFISRMVIKDELMSDNMTTLTFSDPVVEDIPSHIFNLNLLRK
ncbi:MAG: outer membrane lipoprotein-sorting protein [Desulfuromonas sp.]|nr:MAG: outer membrane lipoprotein-sorting protein [Desulfuromonas sp.]